MFPFYRVVSAWTLYYYSPTALCRARYMPSPRRPPVSPFICHTAESVKNG